MNYEYILIINVFILNILLFTFFFNYFEICKSKKLSDDTHNCSALCGYYYGYYCNGNKSFNGNKCGNSDNSMCQNSYHNISGANIDNNICNAMNSYYDFDTNIRRSKRGHTGKYRRR